MFLECKYLFISKYIDNVCICSSLQTITSVAASKLSKYLLSSIRVNRLNVKTDVAYQIRVIHLSYKDGVHCFSKQREFSQDGCFRPNNLTQCT